MNDTKDVLDYTKEELEAMDKRTLKKLLKVAESQEALFDKNRAATNAVKFSISKLVNARL